MTEYLDTWKSLLKRGDQPKIAKLIGKSQPTVSLMMTGKQKATPEQIEIINGYFSNRVNPSELS